EEQIRSLKQVVEDLRSEKSRFEMNASDNNAPEIHIKDTYSLSVLKSKAAAEDSSSESAALEEAFEQLVINGVERRYALSLIKRMRFTRDGSEWNDSQQALDILAEEMMS